MNDLINNQIETETTIADEKPVLSLQQPIWHIFVLSAFTFCFYLIYWFYKTFRDLRNHAATFTEEELERQPLFKKYKLIPPFLAALSAPVPILNLVLMASTFKDLATLTPRKETFASRNPLFAGLALTIAVTGFWVLGRSEGPMYLLFTMACLPVAIAQKWLNCYWSEQEPEGRLVRHAFSPLELVAIIIGAMAVAMVVIGFSVIPTTP